MDPLLAAYLTFTAILVLTPGATTAVVVRNTLQGGRTAGFAAAFGAALANTFHAALAGLGLAVVLGYSPQSIRLLELAGGSYLAWLGCRSLYRAMRHHDGGLRLERAAAEGMRGQHVSGLRQGLAVNLLNPAIATFYLVVLPSFIPSGAPRWHFPALAAIHISMAFACHSAWAIALDRVRRIFLSPTSRRILEAATGIALLILSARILLP